MPIPNINTQMTTTDASEEVSAAASTTNDASAPFTEAAEENDNFINANTNKLPSEQAVALGLTQFKVTGDPTFNCPDCMGEGMNFNANFPSGNICKNCNGSGKVIVT